MQRITPALKGLLITFFILEIISISLPMILKHYMPLTDTIYGIITGTGMGLMVVFLLAIAKLKKKEEFVSR